MSRQYYIDTSSLLALARYLAPFDEQRDIYQFLKQQFANSSFRLIKSVFAECGRMSGGMVIAQYDFLNDVRKEPDIVPTPRHHKRIDHNWHVAAKTRLLSPEEYAARKSKFMAGADFQLIAACMEDRANKVLVTEESKHSNDGKDFKKIPLICEHEGIQCINVVELLKAFNLSATFHIPTD